LVKGWAPDSITLLAIQYAITSAAPEKEEGVEVLTNTDDAQTLMA